jgi:outer membrane murein-binding lipoprotein Lpp
MPFVAAFRRLATALVLLATLALGGCASHTIFNPVTERTEVSTLTEAQLAEQAEEAREALTPTSATPSRCPVAWCS